MVAYALHYTYGKDTIWLTISPESRKPSDSCLNFEKVVNGVLERAVGFDVKCGKSFEHSGIFRRPLAYMYAIEDLD